MNKPGGTWSGYRLAATNRDTLPGPDLDLSESNEEQHIPERDEPIRKFSVIEPRGDVYGVSVAIRKVAGKERIAASSKSFSAAFDSKCVQGLLVPNVSQRQLLGGS